MSTGIYVGSHWTKTYHFAARQVPWTKTVKSQSQTQTIFSLHIHMFVISYSSLLLFWVFSKKSRILTKISWIQILKKWYPDSKEWIWKLHVFRWDDSWCNVCNIFNPILLNKIEKYGLIELMWMTFVVWLCVCVRINYHCNFLCFVLYRNIIKTKK